MEVDKKRMTLMDVFVVGTIFLFFMYLILSSVEKNNPGILSKFKEWVTKKPEEKEPTPESMQQVWHQKGELI